MRGTVQMLLWAWILLNSGASSVKLPEITDRTFIDECVREHNKARSSVIPPASDMLYTTWDEALAITARAWAKNCEFKHNIHLSEVHRMHPKFSSVGENIWTAYPPSSFSVVKAMASWINEKKDYTYQSDTCTAVCGHYTQVVRSSSYKVGCAVQLCPSVAHFYDGEGVLFVCNYAPVDWSTKHPYQSLGAPCSGCEGTCEEKLCRSQERDAEKSYNWTPDWAPDWAPAPSGNGTSRPSYVAILVVRPLALLFTFLTAYAVHYKYPNTFCYD